MASAATEDDVSWKIAYVKQTFAVDIFISYNFLTSLALKLDPKDCKYAI